MTVASIVKIADFKIQGQTSADVEIATLAVELWSDGSVRFTVNRGTRDEVVRLVNPDVMKLLNVVLDGTDGLGDATGVSEDSLNFGDGEANSLTVA